MASFYSSKGIALGLVLGFLAGAALMIPFGEQITGTFKTALVAWNGRIVNVNEVIESASQAPKLIDAMDRAGIQTTFLNGAPALTLYRDGREKGEFTGYDENNAEILKAVKTYPDRFKAFCMLNPADEDKLDKLKTCIENGASGFRLYTGDSFYYNDEYPLDAESMKEVYKWAEENSIPGIMHVNLHFYKDQFEQVLSEFPKLKVLCPHFCLQAKRLSVLGQMLEKYPNLYIDISFGYQDYARDGFKEISDNIENFRNFFATYADRILYGTDVVVTAYEDKTVNWLVNSFNTYRDLLEEKTFRYFLNEEENIQYNGLALDSAILNKIYEENHKAIFAPAK